MVASKAKTVDEFLSTLPEERRPVVTKLRALCKKTLKGFREGMDYGMPSYCRGEGAVEVAFQSQKQYISLYICNPRFREAHTALWEGLDCGKGCIRFKKLEDIDFGRVEQILKALGKFPTAPPQ